jgi:hypothetical protein
MHACMHACMQGFAEGLLGACDFAGVENAFANHDRRAHGKVRAGAEDNYPAMNEGEESVWGEG